MAGEKIITGTGKIWFGLPGANMLDGDVETGVGDITNATIDTEPSGGWTNVAEISKEGFVFAPGQQVQLIGIANSHWPISARQTAASGVFTLSLLNADLDTIAKYGMGEVGVTTTGTPTNTMDLDRNAGPENEIAGFAILFDGFGASIDSMGQRRRRRFWLPRVVNTAPLALAMNDNGPQVVVAQCNIVLASNTSLPPARLIDDLT